MRKEQPPKAPVSEKGPEPSAFDRMRELTRRIVAVPKSELPKLEQKPPVRAAEQSG